MIVAFFRTALRTILKHRNHSVLNILGFSTGLACFALIAIWLNQQLHFDRMHKNADRIFQVNTLVNDGVSSWKEAVTPVPLAKAMHHELPEVENVLRLEFSDAVVSSGKAQFTEDGVAAADPSFFTFFDFKLLKGNVATALSQPYSLVISESMAKKYFGDADPINQSLRLFSYDPDGKGADYLVTGVIEDCPSGSHFTYDMLLSFSTIETAEPETLTQEGWSNREYHTYMMLKEGTAIPPLEEKLVTVLTKYPTKEKKNYHYFLTPLTDIHFQADIRAEIQPGVSKTYLLSFAAIALVVILFACINYVNLTTAYAVDHYKAVGIRKVLGSTRRQLVVQYLTQSWLMAVLAMIVSLGWMLLAKPLFETMLDSKLVGVYTFGTLFTLFAIASVAGIISGIYPAMVITSLQPVQILKGHLSKGPSGMWVRKTLVVVQYSATVLLIIAILTVSRQMKFIRDKDLGFNRENILIIEMNGSPEAMPGYNRFYDQMRSLGSINSISRSNTMIGEGLSKETAAGENYAGDRIDITVGNVGIDHDYLDTYGIGLVAGRNFTRESPSDSSALIINEEATRSLGFLNPHEAMGKHFKLGDRDGEVIGIVKDFHHASLHESIGPLAMSLLPGKYSRISIRMTGDQRQNMEWIEGAWKKSFPNTVFDYSFVDERLRHSYRAEDRFARLYFVFSTISIIIASLGLFALVSYTVERRTKEIGVRKVLGANVLQLATLLSKEFLVLVLVSCAISMPLGWYMMEEWLQGFAYRINVGPEIVVAGFLTLVLALVTLGIRTVRSAVANPVEALKVE